MLGREVVSREELEGAVGDADLVTASRTRLGQLALDPFLDQSALEARELSFVVEIRLLHPPFDVASGHAPAAVLPRNGETRPSRPEHHVRGPGRLLGGHLAGHRVELCGEEIEPLPRHGRHRQGPDRIRCRLRILDQVRFGPDDERTSLGEVGIVGAEFLAKCVQIVGRIRGRKIDDQDECSTTRDVSQEPMAEPLASVRALDQPGDVGDHEPFPARLRDPQVGRQRRERVVGDLGPGRRQPGKERGLPRVRQPDEADVGDRPELQLQTSILALLPRFGGLGHPILRAREPHVAAPAAATMCDDGLRPLPYEVGQEPVLVEHHRAVRHRDHEVFPLRSVTAGAAPRGPGLGPEVRMVREPRQIVEVAGRAEHDVAAPAAVAAVRASLRLVGLAAHRGGAVAAATGAHLHIDLVHERHPEQPRWSTAVRGTKIGPWSNPWRSGWCTSAPERRRTRCGERSPSVEAAWSSSNAGAAWTYGSTTARSAAPRGSWGRPSSWSTGARTRRIGRPPSTSHSPRPWRPCPGRRRSNPADPSGSSPAPRPRNGRSRE